MKLPFFSNKGVVKKKVVKVRGKDNPMDLANTIRDIIAGDPAYITEIPGESKHLKARKPHKHHRHHPSSKSHHRPQGKSSSKTAKKQQKLVKKLQEDPSVLASVLDLLRLMPNPLRPQAAMTQMFDHDWKSMSMPDLTPRANPALAVPSEAADILATEISAQTYWWGYELFFPPVTLQKLEDRGDIATSVLYFLGALAKTVPALYPFVNVIATFVALQFTVIKAMDTGRGIILVATWVVPFVFMPKSADDEDFDIKLDLSKKAPFDL
ncbi:MAG: hypothetical protein DHS80DRAFT_33483 [Piptocephalis tieghemiana]|nr:MAG: hypothetical protein DHS80DRAFT_33483 [Piptocephalis tieghemiana]